MTTSDSMTKCGETDSKDSGNLLKKFAEETSMHGLGRVVSSRSLWLRVLWALLVLIGAGVAAYNVVLVVLAFLEYPVSTVVTIEFASFIQFPAVTICNLNAQRLSKWKNSGFQKLAESEQTTQASASGTTADYDYGADYFDPEQRSELSYKVQDFLQSVEPSARKDLGHQIKDMLVTCQYRDTPCSADDFTQFYDAAYGNCYTFNKDLNNRLTVSHPGPSHGLMLQLNVEEDEYTAMTDTTGFKVVIHHQNDMPFPFDEGVVVSPGFTTEIAISRLDIQRTEPPYGHCVKDGDDLGGFNMYADYYGVGYTDKACVRTCVQDATYQMCGCCDRDIPCLFRDKNGKMLDISFCNTSDTEYGDTEGCRKNVQILYQTDNLGCSSICLPSCRQTLYTSEVSMGRWPSLSKKNASVAYVASRPYFANTSVDADYLRNNIVKLKVFFKQMNYQQVRTVPAYNWSRLLSDLGGQFGLWLGFSLLTAVEILQLVFDICCLIGQRLCCRAAKIKPEKGSRFEIVATKK